MRGFSWSGQLPGKTQLGGIFCGANQSIVRFLMATELRMLGFAIILASTLCGMLNAPVWLPVVGGLGLAIIAIAGRSEPAQRAVRLGQSETLTFTNGASVLAAQLASIGAFAAGWMLGHLFLIN